jgi:peptidoglycan hydrolase-like protein with peptidoglycan-binding domain
MPIPEPSPPTPEDDLDFGQTLRGLRAGPIVFGRYELEGELGRGGMGVVWRARDRRLDLEVALKFLSEQLAHDETAVDDLRRETQRCIRLTHSNIVRVHDLVEEGGVAAIVMEHVEGKTLAKLRLEKTQRVFGVDEVGPWVEQVVDALDYAHKMGRMVHRDLKPSNVMVTESGQVKVMDFGIASSLSDSMSRVSKVAAGGQGTGGGTLPYMSPQQLLGYPPSVADDVYSLGATLYELLTSKPPFFRGMLPSQIQSISPPSMTERRRELGVDGAEPIPERWEEVVAACLEKDSGKRPKSVREVWERLRSVSEVQSGQSGGPGHQVSVVRSGTGSSRRMKVLAAAACLAGLAAWGWWELGKGRAGKGEEKAPVVFTKKVGDPEMTGEIQEGVTSSDDQVVVTSPEKLEGGNQPGNPSAWVGRQVTDSMSGMTPSQLILPNGRDPVKVSLIGKEGAATVGSDPAGDSMIDMSSFRNVSPNLWKPAELNLEVTLNTLLNGRSKVGESSLPGETGKRDMSEWNQAGGGRFTALSHQATDIKPLPPAPTVVLPSRGYFTVSELFAPSSYAQFNSHSQSGILKKVQEELKRQGNDSIAADGAAGPATQGAIIDFQRRSGIKVSGLLDRETLETMRLTGLKESAPPVPVVPTPSPTPTPPVIAVQPATQARKLSLPKAPKKRAPRVTEGAPVPRGYLEFAVSAAGEAVTKFDKVLRNKNALSDRDLLQQVQLLDLTVSDFYESLEGEESKPGSATLLSKIRILENFRAELAK